MNDNRVILNDDYSWLIDALREKGYSESEINDHIDLSKCLCEKVDEIFAKALHKNPMKKDIDECQE